MRRRDVEAGCGGGTCWGATQAAHLEEGELDVREDQIELLAARRLEAQAVGVELEGARRLLAAEGRPDVDVAQPVHLPRPDRLERLLDDEVGLEVLLLVARLQREEEEQGEWCGDVWDVWDEARPPYSSPACGAPARACAAP